MMPLLHLLSRRPCTIPLQPVPPTPTDPDLDERVRDILSHIFGEAHADGESDKLNTSVTKQAASQHREWSQPNAQDVPAADLRKMLSQCQGRDKASVMINGVE
jgi:hypothetical protein